MGWWRQSFLSTTSNRQPACRLYIYQVRFRRQTVPVSRRKIRMEASYLPLDLRSFEELQYSLRKLDETMPKPNNQVHVYHGSNSVAIRGRHKANTAMNGAVAADKTLVDLLRGEWRPYQSPFPVHPLMQSGHLQTLYAAACNFTDVDRVYYARKLLAMHDGGTVALDIVLDSEAQYITGIDVDEDIRKRPDYVKNLPSRIRYMKAAEESELLASDDDRPMLIALHGLSGGSHESYLRAVLHRVIEKRSNWAACSLNSRGCGRTAITTKQLFCASWTEDIRTTMKYLRRQFPNRRFYGVGFSLGANILCNYLGEEGKESPFLAASSVCNPWQLKVATDALNETWIGSQLYSKTMGTNLKRVFMRQYKMMKDHPKIDWKALKVATTIHAFDQAVTAPVFGYKDVWDYYERASSTNKLPDIKTPLLVLHALDDPIVAEVAIPWDGIAANEYTVMAYTQHGGHLGWFMRGGKRWFVTAIADFFEMIDKTITGKTRG